MDFEGYTICSPFLLLWSFIIQSQIYILQNELSLKVSNLSVKRFIDYGTHLLSPRTYVFLKYSILVPIFLKLFILVIELNNYPFKVK